MLFYGETKMTQNVSSMLESIVLVRKELVAEIGEELVALAEAELTGKIQP